MKHPKTILNRSCDPSETRWVVLFVGNAVETDSPYIAYSPYGVGSRKFPTIAEACDYARSQQPLEAP